MPTSPGGALEGHHVPLNKPQVAKAVLEDISTGPASDGHLKRKAHLLDGPRVQQNPIRARFPVDDELYLRNVRNEGGTEETVDITAHGLSAANGVSDQSGGSKSTPWLIDVEGGDDHYEDSPRTSFTPINRQVSRKYADTRGSKLEDPKNSIDSIAQAVIESDVERLTEKDKFYFHAAVAEVEAKFEREKWDLVAEAMKRAGAAEYPKALLKAFAELSKTSTSRGSSRAGFDWSTSDSPSSRNPGPRSAADAITHNEQVDIRGPVQLELNRGNYQGFRVLVDRGSLQHANQQAQSNIGSRMAPQRNHPSCLAMPHGEYSPQQTLPGPSGDFLAMSPSLAPQYQRHPQGVVSYHKPSQATAPSQEPGHENTFAESIASISGPKADTPSSKPVAVPQQGQIAGLIKDPVSRSQVEPMPSYRILNETNRNKSGNAIARGCGVDAPLKYAGLDRAEFQSIHYTDTGAPIFLDHLSPSATASGFKACVSSFDSVQASKSVASRASTSSATLIDLTKDADMDTPPLKAASAQFPPSGIGESMPAASHIGPAQDRNARERSAGLHENRSTAMGKALAQGQAEAPNGTDCDPPKPSTAARNVQLTSSPIELAAQILAAVAAEDAAEAASPARIKSPSMSAASPTPSAIRREEPASSAIPSRGQTRTSERSNGRAVQGSLSGDIPRDEKPRPYACEKCGKAYTTPGGLIYHRTSMPNCEPTPPRPRPYICRYCGKSYQNPGGLVYHQKHSATCDDKSPGPLSRTDSTEATTPKRKIIGPRIVGGAKLNRMANAPGAAKAQSTTV